VFIEVATTTTDVHQTADKLAIKKTSSIIAGAILASFQINHVATAIALRISYIAIAVALRIAIVVISSDFAGINSLVLVN